MPDRAEKIDGRGDFLYYELYIDSVFSGKYNHGLPASFYCKTVAEKKIKKRKLLLSSFIGSALLCVILLTPFPKTKIWMIFGNMAGGALMLKISSAEGEKVGIGDGNLFYFI